MANVVLAGGGSGGHVNPLLATAEELMARGHTVTAVGTAQGIETELVPRAGVELRLIDRVPLPRRPNLDALRFPVAFRRATAQSRELLTTARADAVVGFGGYVSTPVYRAARQAGIPVVVHEANAKPGFANKYGAEFAAAVATTFPDTDLPRGHVTGLPMRGQISDLVTAMSDPATRDDLVAKARAARGWAADAKVLLAFGGSLGAASINAAVAAAVPTLVARGIHVIHLTGIGKDAPAQEAKAALHEDHRDAYQVLEYAHDMADALAAASAVVCRSGANTVSEVTALGLPALYVPLPIGNGEQALNARSAVAAGAARLISDAQLSADRIVAEAEHLLLDDEAAALMRKAAAGVGIPDGASRLADLIEGVLR